MNVRTASRITAALNLALVLGILMLLKNRWTAPDAAPTVSSAPSAQSVDPVIVETPPANTNAPARPFRWEQIVSTDLKVYRDNLRAIGCPAITVHDIILAEINNRFEQRRQSLLAEAQRRFWDLAVDGEMALRYEWGMPIKMLARERQVMIEDILGDKDYGFAEAAEEKFHEMRQRQLGWLPAEKRDQLFALEQKRQHRLEEWSKSMGARLFGEWTDEDKINREAVLSEFADARQGLLTPVEVEESHLRDSKESLWASGLPAFEPTPEEWRKVTRLRVEVEAAHPNSGPAEAGDEARQQRAEELAAQLVRATRDALGPERFAQYEMANDQPFQAVHNVTQRYGLPDSIATEAYQMQQVALSQAERVRNDATLSPETRQAMLLAIQKETRRTLAGTLGEKVLATYQEYGGQWLAEFGRSGNE